MSRSHTYSPPWRLNGGSGASFTQRIISLIVQVADRLLRLFVHSVSLVLIQKSVQLRVLYRSHTTVTTVNSMRLQRPRYVATMGETHCIQNFGVKSSYKNPPPQGIFNCEVGILSSSIICTQGFVKLLLLYSAALQSLKDFGRLTYGRPFYLLDQAYTISGPRDVVDWPDNGLYFWIIQFSAVSSDLLPDIHYSITELYS
jgi:hypothetical protein